MPNDADMPGQDNSEESQGVDVLPDVTDEEVEKMKLDEYSKDGNEDHSKASGKDGKNGDVRSKGSSTDGLPPATGKNKEFFNSISSKEGKKKQDDASSRQG
ncbi:uncharacterized protein VDAG_04858 [Verticillium dahliae VdLs.17]|uniref:Uncharacterized protein n=1 Tax=Verticillium dahliae (strain VdLs.17 / ATCC MYA-4575 / FGSC 10137) TaxID=498257 RepID=G2X373_VERDV|nr:uncharacterized protein VDAG_04858 [Verticillium dahliae VdLs.17]EGY23420.1 hypothetical protein VDAG_04858 [Verticillium dahliae VdLs.17]